ncbi:MAG: hypothetical protein USCAAHI_00846 [Beijerinckiaceae bacterium]|nr:MAG: hypothetical protein USCAAHI_00846 [Beijerinckiaceae bacterium]
MKALGAFLEWLRTRFKGSKGEEPSERTQPREQTIEAEDLQLPHIDSNKLHHIFDNPRHGLDGL